MIISKNYSPPQSHASPSSLFIEEEVGTPTPPTPSSSKMMKEEESIIGGGATEESDSRKLRKVKHVIMLPFTKAKRRLWVHQIKMNSNNKPCSFSSSSSASASDAAAAAAAAATKTTITNHASHPPGKKTKKSKSENNSNRSRRTSSISTSGCKKKLMSLNLCFMHPLTKGGGDSPPQSQSQTSDPNTPHFSYDFLKALIETNDFSSKDCNSHSHFSPAYYEEDAFCFSTHHH